MNRSELIKNYQQLNNSFERKLTFNIGADAGFFSEFNNMVLAMLYCLDSQIKFTLYSRKANFILKKGWNDFFESFCDETTMPLHYRYNRRAYQMKNRSEIPASVIKILSGIDFLTQDIWDSFRSEKFAEKRFNIPELGIENASLLEASSILIFMIWNYNDNTDSIITKIKDSIQLPKSYISMHIRSGDKNLEADVYDIEHYILKAETLDVARNAFILTDNYKVFEQLRIIYKNWNFYTLCSPSEKGYIHANFTQLTKEEKFQQHLKLFASIDICANAHKFIGSFSSNPGMYMGMRIGPENCLGVDYDSWVLW